MLLLVTTGHPDMRRYASPFLGRLVQPRHTSSIRATADAGVPWAADNDCYQGLDQPAYLRMLATIHGLPGCLFVVVPDVVGDADATDRLWHTWAPLLDELGLPKAYVLQDGCRRIAHTADAVFVGGTDLFKTSHRAEQLVKEAKQRGLWVHMGRVNTDGRIRYANSIGCDSVDGSKWPRWKEVWLRDGLASVAAPPHLRLDYDPA